MEVARSIVCLDSQAKARGRRIKRDPRLSLQHEMHASAPPARRLSEGRGRGASGCAASLSKVARSDSAPGDRSDARRSCGAGTSSRPSTRSHSRDCRSAMRSTRDASCSSQSATRFATRVAAARQGTRHGVAVHVHPPWGRPIAQTAGTGRRSSTSTLSTENPPSRSRSASSLPRSRARSGAEWRASQKM